MSSPADEQDGGEGSSLQKGTGTEFTEFAFKLVVVYASSLASFVVGLMWIHYLHRNGPEHKMIQMGITWMRITGWLLLVCHIVLFALEVDRQRSVEFPHFGLVGVFILIIYAGLIFFTNSHKCFRWQVVIGHMVFVIFETFHLGEIDLRLRCRLEHECKTNEFWTLSQLRILWPRGFAAVFLEIWAVLIASYLGAALGWIRYRYAPRLFSTSQPPNELPPDALRRGRHQRPVRRNATSKRQYQNGDDSAVNSGVVTEQNDVEERASLLGASRGQS
eukprot:gb/GECG01003911.1/.p1 GENE.gb/GECG01003911.1/~~gb/GECG01003911.1/.p1  ORF type:complete len:275 (+),score=11.68 gb/GECG01003911.1/:1-825(+)